MLPSPTSAESTIEFDLPGDDIVSLRVAIAVENSTIVSVAVEVAVVVSSVATLKSSGAGKEHREECMQSVSIDAALQIELKSEKTMEEEEDADRDIRW